MATLPIPAPVLLSLAIAAGIIALEVAGWVILCPRFTRLLPFRRAVPGELPTPRGEERAQQRRGSGEHVTWRWHPGSQALLFRNRIELGRKPYCIGRIRLDGQGRWSLAWAPFPFFSWPAGAAAWFAYLLGIGWAETPGGSLVTVMASAIFLLVILSNLYLSRRAFDRIVWPEMQQQLQDWLG